MNGNQKTFWPKVLIFAVVSVVISACVPIVRESTPSPAQSFQTISPFELNSRMETKGFTLINVHIPLEGSIPNTDAEIPYNEVNNYLALLPLDKVGKIIVYCRSGAMGEIAAQTLTDLGFSDVSNLDGGYLAWIESGLPFDDSSQ